MRGESGLFFSLTWSAGLNWFVIPYASIKSETWTYRTVYRNLSDHRRQIDVFSCGKCYFSPLKTQRKQWIPLFLSSPLSSCMLKFTYNHSDDETRMSIRFQYHHAYFCIVECPKELKLCERPKGETADFGTPGLQGTPRDSKGLRGTPRDSEGLQGTPRDSKGLRGTPRAPLSSGVHAIIKFATFHNQ
jgi:hypothetical protein